MGKKKADVSTKKVILPAIVFMFSQQTLLVITPKQDVKVFSTKVSSHLLPVENPCRRLLFC